MATKPKTAQPKTPTERQGRDFFQTPNYAVDLLIPFIPLWTTHIWECASGEGKIANRLDKEYIVYRSDISGDNKLTRSLNFITETVNINPKGGWCIITNPPYSLKYEFIRKAIEYNVPSAFLIPFDMCQEMWDLFKNYGMQGIVPQRRINYITPSGQGSGAQFHSFWFCYKFDLPQQLVFVDLLLKEMKENV